MCLKYHQGFWDGIQTVYRAFLKIGCDGQQKRVLELIRGWAEKELRAWDESPDKRDWRNDRAPICPTRELIAQTEPVKYPARKDELPFLGEEDYESSYIGMTIRNLEED